MTLARTQQAMRPDAATQLARITSLRAQIGQLQRRTATAEHLPAPAPLARLFPAQGPRPGAAYALPDSPSLALALAGEISRHGSWCAFIGMPHLSMRAAAKYGVDPSRVALIPDPGTRWLSAVSSAVEVFPLVILQPPRTPTPAETSRLAARLRERASALFSLGAWPGAELSLSIGEPQWHGLGDGYGLISAREITVEATGRALPASRRTRVLLPGPSGTIETAHPAHAFLGTAQAPTRRTHLTAVAS